MRRSGRMNTMGDSCTYDVDLSNKNAILVLCDNCVAKDMSSPV